jgi:hypothetical protein
VRQQRQDHPVLAGQTRRLPSVALEQGHLLPEEGDLQAVSPILVAARRNEVEQQGKELQTAGPIHGASLSVCSP